MQALSGFANALKMKDLRSKILFTLGILIIYRLGGHITTPGVNTAVLAQYFAQNNNNLFGMYDAFTGGAFQKATIFAIGIMPYISASIIIQLMGSVVPSIQQLKKEGAEGRAKINQWTRYLTVLISVLQSYGIATWLVTMKVNTGMGEAQVILEHFSSPMGIWGFKALTVLTMTTGTIFIMWLGEQINNRGLGNGISLIIFIGIISTVPATAWGEFEQFLAGDKKLPMEVIIITTVIAIITFIVFVEQGTRRIPLQSPRQTQGSQLASGQAGFLPFKVNTAGVIPVIFASSIMFLPGMLGQMLSEYSFAQSFLAAFTPGHWVYSLIMALLIIFFAYFYTAIQYNPSDIADNLKKNGSFIPGVRPGRATAEFIDRVLTRITLPGSLFLALISVGPLHLKDALGMSFYIGGTSVLIVVGVALDTLRQLEAQLHTKNYDGFLKKGRIRGRNAS